MCNDKNLKKKGGKKTRFRTEEKHTRSEKNCLAVSPKGRKRKRNGKTERDRGGRECTDRGDSGKTGRGGTRENSGIQKRKGAYVGSRER